MLDKSELLVLKVTSVVFFVLVVLLCLFPENS